MKFKDLVEFYIKESKVRTKEELEQLYKDTAKILGVKPSDVKIFVNGPHSETGPGLGLNIVTPSQLANEYKEYTGEIK